MQDMFKQHARLSAQSFGQQLGIEVDFADGRRTNDILIVRAQGERRLGRMLYNHLVDELPGVVVELFESDRVSSDKTLIAISQPALRAVENERRSRLKGRAARSSRFA